MNEGKLKQILFALQDQNKELLNMVMHLQVSNNQLKKQLNMDFQNVYTEIYEPKNIENTQDFLKSKKFMMEEMNAMTDKETHKVVEVFEDNLEYMEENLEKIVR